VDFTKVKHIVDLLWLKDLDIPTTNKTEFGVTSTFLHENISLAHDIYLDNKNSYQAAGKVQAVYMDEDGITHRYNSNNFTKDGVLEWIEGKKYQGSLLKYKTPVLLGEGPRRYWAYFKKDVRRLYRSKAQKHVDAILRKFGISYLCDLDPLDAENIKPNQKTDRQILFIFAAVWWVVETAWGFISPAAPAKTKSKIRGSKKKTESEE
jgi:hypothetical protein